MRFASLCWLQIKDCDLRWDRLAAGMLPLVSTEFSTGAEFVGAEAIVNIVCVAARSTSFSNGRENPKRND